MLGTPISDEEKNRAQKLLKGFPEGTEEAYYTFRETGDEAALKKMIGGMVGFYLPANNPNYKTIIGDDVELATIGIDSLGMTEMVFQVEELFDISVGDEEVLQVKKIADISVILQNKLNEGNADNPPSPA